MSLHGRRRQPRSAVLRADSAIQRLPPVRASASSSRVISKLASRGGAEGTTLSPARITSRVSGLALSLVVFEGGELPGES